MLQAAVPGEWAAISECEQRLCSYCREVAKITNVLLHGCIWAKFLVRAEYVNLMTLVQLVCL